MFDLEAQIKQWRAELARGGIKDHESLDELEGHLRQDLRILVSAGEPEQRAFDRVVSRLGTTDALCAEFSKTGNVHIWPVKIGGLLWLAAVVATAIPLLRALYLGTLGRLLFAHITLITAGYTGTLLLAGFGVCHVWMTRSRRLSVARRQSLDRAASLVCRLAVGLVSVGMVLGMLWRKRHQGVYWGWQPMETGCLCVIVWFAALATTQRLNFTGERTTMLLCIGGGIVVSLAWFGTRVFLVHQLKRGNGLSDYWPLTIIVGIQLGFLAMGLAHGRRAVES